AKEIIGNESQERMGLVIAAQDLDTLHAIAARERAPMYVVGEVTGDHHFSFLSNKTGEKPMDLDLADMFGSSPKTIMRDTRLARQYQAVPHEGHTITEDLKAVLRLEAVACKDWLTNKVDRCVGGRVAKQQCAGPLQLPLNNCGVMVLDYEGKEGIATSIGHAPISALIDAAAGSHNAIAEALTNILWAPLKQGLKSVSLSANWMWPCRNAGEDARLYDAVQAVSDFCITMGINVPTGKDSLSMKQKYGKEEVLSPGTVVISTVAHCDDIRQVVEPVLKKNGGAIYYINLSKDRHHLGGSSYAQIKNKIGSTTPDIKDAKAFAKTFDAIQSLIKKGWIQAGHDVSAGGLITTLLEMCFSDISLAANINLTAIGEPDLVNLLFAENAGIVFQSSHKEVVEVLKAQGIDCHYLGEVVRGEHLTIQHGTDTLSFHIPELRDIWYETSYLLDQKQTANNLAATRYENYKKQPLQFQFPKHFDPRKPLHTNNQARPKAAILREKGSNSEREMANAMYLAGFDVKDIHMTDLISGRENLEDIQFLGAVGGFSNSDVLGSAKGWAGAFRYNEKARMALENFFKRDDVLSVGICNGCQLFMELDLLYPDHEQKAKMTYNDSNKHESNFTSVYIEKNNSVMLSSLAGSRLGIWISHGEGKFHLPLSENEYHIVAKYGYDAYPA
ncbi:MAG TPA: phosphoribosylformylglycinamidine synthase, partial [Phaeodactylibacter sp.]|nr:phosphoribosylformylglycinamidine synthase [Phaeodactylibacter sp.]